MKIAVILVVSTITLLSGCKNNVSGKVGNKDITPAIGYRALNATTYGDGNVLVSWRYLPGDAEDMVFDVYRKEGGGEPVKINDTPIASSTNFLDKGANLNKSNEYLLYPAGSNKVIESFVFTSQAAAKPYLSIPLKEVEGNNFVYAPGDICIGDLDGDGKYEIVVKREPKPQAQAYDGLSEGTMLLEAYKLDGAFMWRVDMGPNIRQGNHYNSFTVYDYDGDGKAEVAIRTAEGTVFGDGTKTGDVNGDGITEYEDATGRMLAGPEFLSVIDGMTGKELARADYIARGNVSDWGDSYGNRCDIFLNGMGYFDGTNPSILICRGLYAKTVLEAWDYRDGKLTKRWRFDTTADNGRYKDYELQGAHSISVGDIDGDGKDEIIYGACAIDDDGTGLYNTNLQHGDALHLGKFDPEREGLQVWMVHEKKPGSGLRDARTGEVIFWVPAAKDVGRGIVADIDPESPGCEMWSPHSDGSIWSCRGDKLNKPIPPSGKGDGTYNCNMAIWWTGSLNRQLLDDNHISRWTPEGTEKVFDGERYGVISINGTKANPCFYGDFLGDWREEIIFSSSDKNELRIFSTPHETEYRFPTLMSDHIYMLSAIHQNVAYNQPTHTGYYIGSDLIKK